MALIYLFALVVIAVLSIGLHFLLKMRALETEGTGHIPRLSADRYRPMLRLLSDADMDFIPADKRLRSSLRARRRTLFRGYLRCLTRDYSQLLAGIRRVMVESGMDRPDLARALAKNRMLFAVAMCKVEYRLALHAAGIGHVEIAGLVEAIEVLRSQVTALATPAPQAA